MILDNGTIITMDEALPRASALAIAGGRIIGGVDSREDSIASHAHERVDLQGMCVVPGLVDAHVHFRGWAASRIRPRLAGCASVQQLLAVVRDHAAGLDAGAWVLGAGWRDELAAPGADLATALDEAAGGRPVALTSHDHHALLVTRSALERAGVAPDGRQLEQPGGIVERLPDDSFSGVLREESAWQLRRAVPDDDLDERALAAAMREASRRGVTTLHDLDGAEGLRSWRALHDGRGLTLRVWQHLLAADLPAAGELGLATGFGGDRLRIGGIKCFVDGTLGSGTAWLRAPELGDDGRTPVVITPPDQLRSLAAQAARAGFPLLVHAIGDAAVGATIDALEATAPLWQGLRCRPRIEHAQLMSRDDMRRCAELGIALSVQPTHMVADRDVAEQRWGDRLEGAYAFASMVRAGCGLMLGSDAPIEDLHPLAALHAAIERDGGAHGLDDARGAWHGDEALTPDVALRASTCWPADAMGSSHELGRLVPGRLADLVVLSGNPLEQPVASIEVVATMVGGRWVHGAGNVGRSAA